MVPLNLMFDGVENIQGSDTVHFPKLSQGAPYSFGLRVRYEDGTYRHWEDIVEMRWRIKLRPTDRHELMTMHKSEGNFIIDTLQNQLTLTIRAENWEGIVLPNSSNHLETDVPFSHVIEFLDVEGVVIERFAQGSGLINVNLFL